MMANPNPAALVNQPPPTVTRKSITGFVTKLVGDGATYGFINDEIFFQQTNVTDGPAGVNDRVFAECEYSAHLPIKWNATSIKIVARASSSASATAPTSILDSDPRRQSRQGMLMNQQQQQQPQTQAAPQQPQAHFSAPSQQQQPQQQQTSAPVANTYQQHRQLKQQQQHLLPNQHELIQPPMGPLDAGLNQAPEFFAPFGQPPPPMQPQHVATGLPAFDTPMGPPKLEYTSQLGSAFVQNQFMAAPLLPQQTGTPLLPQARPQQQQQQQQQHQHQNQHNNNNNSNNMNKRDHNRNQHNRDNYNNDKNDRNNQNNRGRNRNENKFDQNRGGSDRDNSNNSRSSRAGSGSRDRSGGRSNDNKGDRDGSKREGIVKRPSPARNSARSANSVSSDRSNKASSNKRHYDPHNIPRTTILTNMNAWNMRSRCPSSIHVPSDLKNIIVNPHLRLDVKNLPKPLSFKIESPEDAQGAGKEQEGDEAKKEVEAAAGEASDDAPKPSSASDANDESQQSNGIRKDTDNTPPSSKSDLKLNHKYGVKVVLISLPELEAIYKKVAGEEPDASNKDNKSHARLDEAISLLCNTGSNGGHSLIGGKFDPVADGFVEGESNEFERHGRQPDLIATCRRVVAEHTGFDLGPCQSWTLVSTFIYNNKTDYFSPKASIEYSYIYLPHIWSMASPDAGDSQADKESVASNLDSRAQGDESGDVSMEEAAAAAETAPVAESAVVADPQATDEAAAAAFAAGEAAPPAVQELPENLSNLKVVELKARLDERGIAYKPNAKKADLLLALTGSSAAAPVEPEVASTEDSGDQTTATDAQDQLEEGEVVASGTTTPTDDMENTSDEPDEMGGGEKRKAEEDNCDEQQDSKRIKEEEEGASGGAIETEEDKQKRKKKGDRVELIKEPFVVRALKGQQQLSVVALADVVQVSRYDQFELSVVSNILKEALVKHLSEYMFTALVEEHRQRNQGGQGSSDSGSISSGTNSQETNSDSNNNNNNNNNKLISSKNLQQTGDTAATAAAAVAALASKEYPLDRYINLAFSYFDSTHVGYLHADDLSKLFCNTGLTISKRALMSLINESDKFNYRTLADLGPKLDPCYVYKFPDQFQRLPGCNLSPAEAEGEAQSARMVEFQGVKYDVEKLVQQVREAEVRRVNTAERFNHAIENFDKQAEVIQTLEVSQKSLELSIKALNEELGELKRERDVAEKKFENLKAKLEEMLVEVKRK